MNEHDEQLGLDPEEIRARSEVRQTLVKHRARMIMFTRLAVAAGVVLVLIFSGAMAVLMVRTASIADETKNNTEAIKLQQDQSEQVLHNTEDAASNAEEGTRLIRDCVVPGGHCYERGQEQTAQAVGAISQSTLVVISAALTCQSQGVTGVQPLTRCVKQLTTPPPPTVGGDTRERGGGP